MPTLAEAKHKVRDLSHKALAVVENDDMTTAEKKEALDKIEPEIKTWADEVQTLERFEDTRSKALAMFGAGDKEKDSGDDRQADLGAKSLGEQFVQSAGYKSLISGGISGSGKSGAWTTGAVELKTAMTEGTALPGHHRSDRRARHHEHPVPAAHRGGPVPVWHHRQPAAPLPGGDRGHQRCRDCGRARPEARVGDRLQQGR
jgi:hypothetical protein